MMEKILQSCFDLSWNCFDTYVSVFTMIGSIATAVALFYIIRAFQNERNQLFISNFSEITEHIGDEETKEYRGWFAYNEEKKKLLNNFIDSFDENYYNKSEKEREEFKDIEKACWHISARYDRVGVILSNDEKIRKKFLDYHGEAIFQAWNALKPLILKREAIFAKKYQNSEYKNYKYFQELGNEVEKQNSFKD